MTHSTVSEWALPWDAGDGEGGGAGLRLAVAWSLEEPERVGETARVERLAAIGRGGATLPDALEFARERPASRTVAGPLTDPRISRRQLEVSPAGEGELRVRNVGKCPLAVNGVAAEEAVVRAGDTVTLRNSVVLLVVGGPGPRPLRGYPASLAFHFGRADAHGMVGESAAAWRLRDALALSAALPHHVLLHGPSGAGKELAARAIHALSPRAAGPIVTRNAATLPEALVDAELFGNLKNYPNPGMSERRGLVGEADGGTLFLDEIGELPAVLQAHLLRVLDAGGEHHRLGDSRPSVSDFRLVGATNRQISSLKHDLAARFTARIEVPSLAERREDIPLLIRHVLARGRAEAPLLDRFASPAPDGAVAFRVDPTLVERLVRHPFHHELRELERLLFLSATTSTGKYLALTKDVASELDSANDAADPSPGEPTAAQIQAALGGAGGSVTVAAKVLGLKNRFALYRLMKRHGLGGAADEAEE